jgi:hypothetical protein
MYISFFVCLFSISLIMSWFDKKNSPKITFAYRNTTNIVYLLSFLKRLFSFVSGFTGPPGAEFFLFLFQLFRSNTCCVGSSCYSRPFFPSSIWFSFILTVALNPSLHVFLFLLLLYQNDITIILENFLS